MHFPPPLPVRSVAQPVEVGSCESPLCKHPGRRDSKNLARSCVCTPRCGKACDCCMSASCANRRHQTRTNSMHSNYFDFTCLPSGKLIVIGFEATRLLSTSTPSIINIDVAPVSAIACCVSIVIALRDSCVGIPNRWCAAAANGCGRGVVMGTMWRSCSQFDVTIVRSSSSEYDVTA